MTSKDAADLVGYVFAVSLAAVLWAWLWLHVISKIGYRGLSRKLWLVGMCIPPFLSITMILLLVLPWPVHKQLKQLKKQVGSNSGKSGVDDELEQLRRQMQQ